MSFLSRETVRSTFRKDFRAFLTFCGCGTAIAVAERLKREWIGIDITHLAITLIKHRLFDAFRAVQQYEVVGEPVSLTDAQTLAQQDPYQFRWWALGLADARPVERKKGADKGIDGRLYFHDEPKPTKQVIFSVKAGGLHANYVRDLRGVIEREKAPISVLITIQEPTQPMRSIRLPGARRTRAFSCSRSPIYCPAGASNSRERTLLSRRHPR